MTDGGSVLPTHCRCRRLRLHPPPNAWVIHPSPASFMRTRLQHSPEDPPAASLNSAKPIAVLGGGGGRTEDEIDNLERGSNCSG